MRIAWVVAAPAMRGAVLWALCSANPAALAAQSSAGWLSNHGALVGAGVGMAAGFGLAKATDYPLEEGGAFTVFLLGGGLGAIHGHKLASSLHRPWRAPGRLQVTLPWGVAWSDAPGDIEQAFAISGLTGTDGHHPVVPSATVMYDAVGPLRVGAEISGVRGVHMRAANDVGHLSETVDGKIYTLLLAMGTRPTDANRLAVFAGAGLDRYSVEALAYFDLRDGVGLPPETSQTERSATARAENWGLQARIGIELYLTDEVSLDLDALHRWNDAIEVSGIRLIDSDGQTVAEYGEHSVSLRAFQITLGMGLRF